jgi:hypothetical protein
MQANPRFDFRIPISPTPGFYSQVRLYNYALRRLGAPYSDARLVVVVGDNCDIDAVRRQNPWSDNFNVEWAGVPHDIFSRFGIFGTGTWRLNVNNEDADFSLLVDADTVLLNNIDPLLDDFSSDRPVIYGHMAHFPPPFDSGLPIANSPDFWPGLFERMGVPLPQALFRYSMDAQGTLPLAPAYFNFGFVGVNKSARSILADEMWSCIAELTKIAPTPMRGQIALTMIAYKHGFDIKLMPAHYNAANDIGHLSCNNVAAQDIRVLHYLREDEFVRSTFLLDENVDAFLSKSLKNPASAALQQLVQEFRENISRGY